MRIHILDLVSIYTFQKDQSVWANKAPRRHSIVSYQVEGHYDHTFSSGVLPVKKDHIFTINPNDGYTVQQIAPGCSICFIFAADQAIPTQLMDCTDDPRFLLLFRKLLQYKDLNHEASYCMALSVAYEILALMEQKRNAQYYQSTGNIPFLDVRDRLMRDFRDPSLDAAALSANYSFSDKYFRERFRELFGSTPTQYLIRLRLNEAARLLSQGTHTVTEVAQAVGFSDLYYFSRLFKKHFLCPPSSFRTRAPKDRLPHFAP